MDQTVQIKCPNCGQSVGISKAYRGGSFEEETCNHCYEHLYGDAVRSVGCRVLAGGRWSCGWPVLGM